MGTTAKDFSTPSLARDAAGRDLSEIMGSAVAAVAPERCVREHVRRTDAGLQVGARTIALPRQGRIRVAGAGKAGEAMARTLVELLGDEVVDGVVAVKRPPDAPDPDPVGRVRLLGAGHPVPDARSVAAGQALLEVARASGPDDLLICPISGGASALACAPVEGLSLADLAATTAVLLGSGLPIAALNVVRRHLDELKGGGLALAAAPSAVVSLVMSDVPDDRLSDVGSGPTAADPSCFADALAIVGALPGIPGAVIESLARGARGERPDNPRPGDPRLARVFEFCIGGNHTARAAAAQTARELGYTVIELPPLQGEARRVGAELGRRLAQQSPGVVAIAGGETTVTVHGTGRGGRNQELALGATTVMLGLSDAILATLATDGEDGPTDAAGAVVRGNTLPRALERGLDPLASLANNDAYGFFAALGDLLRPGPTGTNVCDLALLLTRKR